MGDYKRSILFVCFMRLVKKKETNHEKIENFRDLFLVILKTDLCPIYTSDEDEKWGSKVVRQSVDPFHR
mgnify:CR=1 FL=1